MPKFKQAFHPLKTSTCLSLTNTSKISYKIAIDNSSNTHDSPNLYFQIIKNSATGKFSEEWITYNDVKSTLPIGTFSSVPLRTLYRNKSLNTPGLLLAALFNEGVVEKEAGKRLLYRTCPDDAFLAEMQQLIDAEIDVTYAPEALGSDKASDKSTKSYSAVSAIVKSHTCAKKPFKANPKKVRSKRLNLSSLNLLTDRQTLSLMVTPTPTYNPMKSNPSWKSHFRFSGLAI